MSPVMRIRCFAEALMSTTAGLHGLCALLPHLDVDASVQVVLRQLAHTHVAPGVFALLCLLLIAAAIAAAALLLAGLLVKASKLRKWVDVVPVDPIENG